MVKKLQKKIQKKPLHKKCKKKIPRALREQVWLQNIGKQFEYKCLVKWCQNRINPFDFNVGHDIPESKGGGTNINNLKPICNRCNLSMGNHYSINEWSKMGESIESTKSTESTESTKSAESAESTESTNETKSTKNIKKRPFLSWLKRFYR